MFHTKPLSESQLQAKCYRHAFNTYPSIRQLLFSVPNGSTRHILEAVQLKATGLTPGIPDMILVYPQLVGFEFKTTVGVLSDAQTKVHDRWRSVGIRVEVVRSFEQWVVLFESIIGVT